MVECGGFADVSGAGQPDVPFHVLPFMVGWADRPPIEAHGIAIGRCFLRPKSRGLVHLRSSKPQDKALFDAGSFKDSDDLEVLVRGVLKGIGLFEAPALAKLINRRHLLDPGLEKDMDGLRHSVRQAAKTVFHPVGTAKMGPDTDRMAVVDGELRVRGVTGLRVVDALVMPTLVSGNTNAPTMMLAEPGSSRKEARLWPEFARKINGMMTVTKTLKLTGAALGLMLAAGAAQAHVSCGANTGVAATDAPKLIIDQKVVAMVATGLSWKRP